MPAEGGGLEQVLFPCGDDLTLGGRHMCNIWQGDFLNVDTVEGEYLGRSVSPKLDPASSVHNCSAIYSAQGGSDYTRTAKLPTLVKRLPVLLPMCS